MKYLTICIALLLSTSCVATSGDIQRLADAQVQYEQETTNALHKYQQGLSDTQEYAEETAESAARLHDEWVATGKDIEQRVKDTLEATSVPVTGNPLMDKLLGVLIAGGGAVFATNKVRDGRRRKRGERVEVAPPPS